jgi:hypothetical protein
MLVVKTSPNSILRALILVVFSQRNSAPTDFTQLLWQSPKVSFAYNSLIPAFFLTLGKKGGKSNPTLCFLFLQSDYRVSQIRALTIQYVEYAVATKKQQRWRLAIYPVLSQA